MNSKALQCHQRIQLLFWKKIHIPSPTLNRCLMLLIWRFEWKSARIVAMASDKIKVAIRVRPFNRRGESPIGLFFILLLDIMFSYLVLLLYVLHDLSDYCHWCSRVLNENVLLFSFPGMLCVIDWMSKFKNILSVLLINWNSLKQVKSDFLLHNCYNNGIFNCCVSISMMWVNVTVNRIRALIFK